MTLPVLDAAFEVLHGRDIFCPTLLLVDLVGDTLCGCNARFQFVEVRVLILAIENFD